MYCRPLLRAVLLTLPYIAQVTWSVCFDTAVGGSVPRSRLSFSDLSCHCRHDTSDDGIVVFMACGCELITSEFSWWNIVDNSMLVNFLSEEVLGKYSCVMINNWMDCFTLHLYSTAVAWHIVSLSAAATLCVSANASIGHFYRASSSIVEPMHCLLLNSWYSTSLSWFLCARLYS
jgi:hypothetical protein